MPETKRDSMTESAAGTYIQSGIDADGIFRSWVLDCLWLKVDWIWQDPPPTRTTILKESGLA
jgi:hypothetical protein